MKKNYFLILLVLAFVSCKKELPTTNPSQVVDVYVAGVEHNSPNTNIAMYWKNGQTITLGPGGASSIAVMDSDVYVIDGGVDKYWKNGQAIALTDGTRNAYVTGIFLVKR